MCGRSGKVCWRNCALCMFQLCMWPVCLQCTFAFVYVCGIVLTYSSEDPRRDVIIEDLPAGFTQSTWPHRRWWKWIKDWGESCFKKAFRAPPFLNYLHNGLLILSPPLLHSELFISFLSPLHTSELHSIIFILPRAFISDQIAFILSICCCWIHPVLPPCPSYLKEKKNCPFAFISA